MPDVNIEPMDTRDTDVVKNIVKGVMEFNSMDVQTANELIDEYVKKGSSSGYHIVVAREDEINGYLCFGPTPLTLGTWDMYWLAVDQRARGHGIGSALIKYAENYIERNNGRLILIETSSTRNSESARKLYYTLGYKVICHIPDYYDNGDDKVIFQKRII